jgi:hypothetical protein
MGDKSSAPCSWFAWLFAPPWLGGNLGLFSGAGVAGAVLAPYSSEWNSAHWWQILLAGGCGWFGGCIGSMTARDWLLREDWVNCRWLVGLCAGGAVGIFFAVHALIAFQLWDLSVLLGGVAGGSFGGFLDALFHRNVLEEGE